MLPCLVSTGNNNGEDGDCEGGNDNDQSNEDIQQVPYDDHSKFHVWKILIYESKWHILYTTGYHWTNLL